MADFLVPAQEFESPEDALAHYGVKGMKWGVRRSEGGSGRSMSPETKAFVKGAAITAGAAAAAIILANNGQVTYRALSTVSNAGYGASQVARTVVKTAAKTKMSY